MNYQPSSHRFVKLLGVAWAACLLLGYGLLSGLGAALPIALITWLIIRKHPAENFELFSKPTFAMLLFIGLTGVGAQYNRLQQAGVSTDAAFAQAYLSLGGLFMLIGILGLIKAPSSRSDLVEDATDAPNH
jgi:hypothetical protein